MGIKTVKTALCIGALSGLMLPSVASAQFRFYRNYNDCNQCQPAYPSQPTRSIYPGQPVYPGQPGYPGQPQVMPSPGTTPDAKKDAEAKKDEAPMPPDQQPAQQPDQQPQADQQQQAQAGPDLSGGVGEASYNVGMLGRGDANNRFNLFDNMSAIPQSRVWWGYQHLSGFNTGATAHGFGPDYAAFANPRRQLNLYRVGAEYALNDQLSIVAQTQYIASAGVEEKNDSWANPQFAIKYVLSRSFDSVLSAFLGVQPECSVGIRELRETETRIYPGVLYYRVLGPRTFVQGGAQLGLNTGNLANTFDFAGSVGYWLYKDCAANNCGGGCCGNYGCGCQPHRCCHLTGVIAQVELLGKEVLDNASNVPFAGLYPTTTFQEARHVYDVTMGVRFLFARGLGLAVGASLPLTGGQVRNAEFLSTVSYNF